MVLGSATALIFIHLGVIKHFSLVYLLLIVELNLKTDHKLDEWKIDESYFFILVLDHCSTLLLQLSR